MACPACIVVPGLPHHVTQCGNGRQRAFFRDKDCALYRVLLGHLRRAESIGRQLSDAAFFEAVAARLGRKPRTVGDGAS